LEQSSSLQELVVSDNHIGDEGAKMLAAALSQNSSLLELNLNGNEIGDQGAKALGAALAQNVSLTTLYLAWNQIGPEGEIALVDGFEPITSSPSSLSSSSMTQLSATEIESTSFNIFVKVMNGDIFSIECNSQDSVQSLKRKLCQINPGGPAYSVYRLDLVLEDPHQGSHHTDISSSSSSVEIDSQKSTSYVPHQDESDPICGGSNSSNQHFPLTLSDSHALAEYQIMAEDTLNLFLLPRKVCCFFDSLC
jgi:hypothetical protein